LFHATEAPTLKLEAAIVEFEFMEKKSYVVYNGRKNGVYTSWVDCYAQANGFADCVVRLYDCVREGQQAWQSYSLNCKSSLQTKRSIESQIFNGTGYMSGILSNIVEETG
jgi:ribonuclease HI